MPKAMRYQAKGTKLWVLMTAIHDALPHNLSALLRRHPLKCPVAFISGRHSREMKQVGMTMTKQMTRGRISKLDGTRTSSR